MRVVFGSGGWPNGMTVGFYDGFCACGLSFGNGQPFFPSPHEPTKGSPPFRLADQGRALTVRARSNLKDKRCLVRTELPNGTSRPQEQELTRKLRFSIYSALAGFKVSVTLSWFLSVLARSFSHHESNGSRFWTELLLIRLCLELSHSIVQVIYLR